MEEGNSNRSTWKFGRIVEVHPGNDGFVRGATVEVASSTGERKLLKRPLQKLFPLEVREVGGSYIFARKFRKFRSFYFSQILWFI